MAIISTLWNNSTAEQRTYVAIAAAVVPLLYFAVKAVLPKIPSGVPGPYPWFLVGQTSELMKYAKDSLHKYMIYGHGKWGPIFAVPLFGPAYTVFVSHPEATKQILTDSANFGRGHDAWNAANSYFPNALFLAPPGPLWYRHRKLLMPAFGPSHLRLTRIAAQEIAGKVASEWRLSLEKAGQREIVVNLHDYFTAVAFDVIARIAFSRDVGAVESVGLHEYNKTMGMFDEVFKILQLRVFTPSLIWPLMGLGDHSPRVANLRASLQKFVKDIIADRRAAMSRGERNDKGGAEMDVLDRLLVNSAQANDDGEGLSEEEIAGETMGLFTAGHETTSNSLTCVVLALCENPDVMARLVAEIDKYYEDVNGEITYEVLLGQFKYLDCVIKEAMRLYPVIPGLARETLQPVEILGHVFPAKTQLIATFITMQRDPLYWTDPMTFNPDRWASPPVPGTFIPFGDGPNVCIGQKMANIEMRAVLVYLLRRFTLSKVEGQHVDFVMSITVGLKNGYKVKVAERNF
ncbi:cytochrome P450, partial [Entophlyctis helioformis]